MAFVIGFTQVGINVAAAVTESTMEADERASTAFKPDFAPGSGACPATSCADAAVTQNAHAAAQHARKSGAADASKKRANVIIAGADCWSLRL